MVRDQYVQRPLEKSKGGSSEKQKNVGSWTKYDWVNFLKIHRFPVRRAVKELDDFDHNHTKYEPQRVS
jgi:hypothetical protein